jgi:ATP-dependent DNA ligase
MPGERVPAWARKSLSAYGADCSRSPPATMPLDVAPSRTSRFGTPLELSGVHWLRPELVAEVKYLTWTLDNLLRQVALHGPA